MARAGGVDVAGRVRRARKQALGVGVALVSEEIVHRSLFDDAAAIHDDDVMGDLGDHAEVVGDEQDRHAELSLQAA